MTKKRGPGRPSIGPTVKVLLSLPTALARDVARAAAAEKVRVTEWLRRAARERAERQR